MVNIVVTSYAHSNEVFLRVPPTLRAVDYVVQLQPVFTTDAAQRALVAVAIKHLPPHAVGNVLRILATDVFIEACVTHAERRLVLPFRRGFFAAPPGAFFLPVFFGAGFFFLGSSRSTPATCVIG